MAVPLSDADVRGIRARKDISQSLARHLRFPDKTKKNLADAYICPQDVRTVWAQDSTIANALYPALLSPEEYMRIRKDLIIFLSILVFIRADDFLDGFKDWVFSNDDSLAFFDDRLPLEESDLPNLGDYMLEQRFLHDQYLFLPFVIKESAQSEDVDSRRRLPFEDCSIPILSGAYGVVTRDKIVACKRFSSSTLNLSVNSKKELENLQILKESFNKNEFVRIHLAILFHGREQIILLPWAEHLDLHLLLMEGHDLYSEPVYNFKERFPNVHHGCFVPDVYAQLVNIAEGLKFLHEGVQTWEPHRKKMYFAHMDLKPANVLIDRQDKSAVGKWVLTGFGFSAFKEMGDDDDEDSTKLVSLRQYLEKRQFDTINMTPKRNPMAYMAPEIKRDGRASRVPTWLQLKGILAGLGQKKAVQAFRDHRKGKHGNDYFYQRTISESLDPKQPQREFCLRFEVCDWLQDIPMQQPDPNDIIKCAVATIKKILIIESDKRPKARKLVKLMQHVERHVKSPQSGSLCPLDTVQSPSNVPLRTIGSNQLAQEQISRSSSIVRTDIGNRITPILGVTAVADDNAAYKDGRTLLHEAVRSGSVNTYGAISDLIGRGANVNAADKDGAIKLYGTSRISLQSVVRFLGFNEESPESAVVTASCSGREDDAILLLQLGVDPIHVSKEWHSRYSTGAKVKMPTHLKIWENSVTRHDYGTIREFVNEIITNDHVSFDSITWEWDLPAILASNIDSDVVLMCTNLGTGLVGNTGRVHAMTYQECLAKYKWVDFIMSLLDLLNRAKLDSAHNGFSNCAMRDPLVFITCSHANLSINFDSKQACHAASDLIEVLDWLCKTMRTPSIEDGYLISSAAYQFERYVIAEDSGYGLSRGSTIELHALRPIASLKTSSLPDFEHNCWLSLFDSCVIVDFPSIQRGKFGKGLELSFDLMIALAAAECCLNINGGLVFVGYQTVLYPVATDGNCAQFDLIAITDGQINPYTLDLRNRLLTNDSFQFKTKRCFVGWCEVAHINLGTRRLHANVGYSGGRNQSRSLESDGYAILGQVGASAPLSAIMGLQKNFKYNRHRVRFTPTGNYLKLLHDTSRQSVVLYDATQHRCWLVPKLSVLLHMSQIYVSRCATGLNGQIPYVDPYTDAMDIVETLESAGEKGILKGQANKLLFRELMFALSINLLNTVEALRESDSGRLYGFEFMDVVHEPGKETCMKKLDIRSGGKAWLELVNAVGTVIVCSELVEAISAAKENRRKSSKCNELPQNCDYLAATLPCLSRLAEQKGVVLGAGSDGIKISEKAVWKLTENLFAPCPHEGTDRDTCWNRPGLVQKVKRPRWFAVLTVLRSQRTQSAQPIPTNGAVVFG